MVLVVAAIDADAYENGLRDLGYHAVADRPRVSLPNELGVRWRAGASRAAPAARRQVDLAPGAAVRRARDRSEHAHQPRDRRRRAGDTRRARRARGGDPHRRGGGDGERHRPRRLARARGGARLRQQRHDDARAVGCARRAAVPLGADRRRVAAPAADGPRVGAVARDGRPGRRPRRRRVRAARRSAAAQLHGVRHELPVAERAGEVGADAGRAAGARARPRSCRRRPAAITASGCSPRWACRSRSTAVACSVRGRRARAVPARRSRRSVVGGVLRRRRAHHAGLRSHDRVAVAQPDPVGFRRRAPPHGCRHRDRAVR